MLLRLRTACVRLCCGCGLAVAVGGSARLPKYKYSFFSTIIKPITGSKIKSDQYRALCTSNHFRMNIKAACYYLFISFSLPIVAPLRGPLKDGRSGKESPLSSSSSSSPRKLATNTNWVQRGNVKLEGGTSSALSANGLVLAVGAPYSSAGPGGRDSGSVQVYEFINGTSYQPRGAVFHGMAATDAFGLSVSLSNNGDVLLVGAPSWYGKGYFNLYKYNNQTAQYVQNFTSTYLAGYGYSVSLSGDGKRVAIGSPREDKASAFAYNADDFTSVLLNRYTDEEFGYSVSLTNDGTVMAVGDRRLGQVYVYRDWVSTECGANAPWFYGCPPPQCIVPGEAVTLSGDGNRLAVRSNATAIVAVYSLMNDGSGCRQIGQSLNISTAPALATGGTIKFDKIDELISLSGDGRLLAVANPVNKPGVQVYEETNINGQVEYLASGDFISIANVTGLSLSDDGKVLAITAVDGSTLVYQAQISNSNPPSTSPTNPSSPTTVSLHEYNPMSLH
ncbi:hypothetical protein ACHAXH_000136, partial [Discostella pseudostelligera]